MNRFRCKRFFIPIGELVPLMTGERVVRSLPDDAVIDSVSMQCGKAMVCFSVLSKEYPELGECEVIPTIEVELLDVRFLKVQSLHF